MARAPKSRAAKARTSPEPADHSDFINYGRSSLKIRGGRIDEEWRDRLRGTKKYKVYREMGDASVTES